MIPAIQELNFPKKDGKQYATLTHATATLADMGEKTTTTQVKIDGDIVPDFSYDWEMEFQGEKYIMPLRIPQGAKENTSLNATIDLTFQHWAIYQLKRWTFVTMQPIEAGTAIADEEVASVQLNLKDFCDLFGQVLEYYYGDAITIDLNPAWQYDNAPTLITIEHTYIWNVLIDAFHGKYGVRWAIEPREDNDNTVKGGERYVIKVGYPTVEVDHIFEYGFEGGLLKLERQVQSEDIRNMIKGRGGETNIPLRYFKDIDPKNPDFKADPDWVEELANIYFTNLRGATFRSYVQGWKAAHISKYPGYKAVGESNAYAPWAYRKGFTDTKFHPEEFVADEITINPGDGDRQVEILPGFSPYIKKGSSIDKYGPLPATLDNNDEIYPTIQGTGLDIAVDVERIESDDVVESVENDAQVKDYDGAARTIDRFFYNGDPTTFQIVVEGRDISVPAGATADLEIINADVKAFRANRFFNRDKLKPADVADYELESYEIEVITTSGETISPIAIPAGSYTFRVIFNIRYKVSPPDPYNNYKFTASFGGAKLVTSTIGEQWTNTFNVWVKDIWNSTKVATETDAQYAERVWKPVLGNREGNTAKVVFTSGMLVHEDYEFTIEGFPVPDTSKTYTDEDGVTHISHWRMKLAKSDAELEATGLYVPSTQKQGKAGDTFVFIGTEMTHVPYVVNAEVQLDDWKKDHLGEVKEIKPTFVVTTDRVRLNNEGRDDALINQLRVGNSIRLADKRFIQAMGDRAYETLYLQSITYTYREPSSDDAALNPDVEIVLGNEYTTSANPVSVMQGEISSMQKLLGSISNVEQIVRAVGDRLYLRKDGISDRSLSPTQFFSLLTSGDFRAGIVGGAGWGFYKDENGNWVLEADRVNVRQEMQVNTLVINQAEGRGGMEIDTAAFMEVTRVVETNDSYVCYFDQKDGSVANLFHVDDVAYCNRWTPENEELKFYKRRVTAVGVDNITLSKTEVNGTGIPAEKDNIIHFGNYSDKTRQYVKVRDVVGGGYERFLDGLDSVDATGTEYYFVGRQAGMYNDRPRWYIGDDNGFIEWVNGKLTIKGSLSIQSTIGNRPVGDYVSDVAKTEADKAKAELQADIEALQEQVDGVIESFNGLGAPTLGNYPANEWTTDEERRRHSRDIYTDITPYVDDATTPTSGQSWKWYYNSPTDYGWVKIADSDAVKALQLAAMSVRDTDVLYISHTSQTVAPALPTVGTDGAITSLNGWATAAPEWRADRYIWQTTYTRKGDGTAYFSGPTCIQGARGETGPQGIPGPTGADGKTTYTWLRYADDANGGGMSNSPTGKKYMGLAYNKPTATESNNPGDYAWSLIQGPKGDQGVQGLQGLQGEKGDQGVPGTPGADGKTSYFHIKYAPVSNPTASQMTETPSDYIGTYVDYTATDSADPSKYTWARFKGLQGADGAQGIPGVNGADGKTSYLHIKYSNDGGNSFTPATGGMAIGETPGDYIGQYTDFVQSDSTDPSKYTWSKIKGEQGSQGIPGPKGDDGTQYWTWIKYSDNADGTGMYDTPTDHTLYIGIAVNKTVQAESNNPGDYTWSRFRGADGASYTANLLTGTRDFSGTWGSISVWQVSADKHLGFTVMEAVNQQWKRLFQPYTVEYGKTYTFSAWVKVKYTSGAITLRVAQSNHSNTTPVERKITDIVKDGEWHHLAVTFTATDPNDLLVHCGAEASLATNTIYVAGYKLEEGANASPEWTPAASEMLGTKGEEGNGIAGIDEYYATGNSGSVAPTSWQKNPGTVPAPSASAKYLWNYEEVRYTSGNVFQTKPHVVSMYSADGKSLSVKSTVSQWRADIQGVTPPTAGWLSSIPAVPAGQYLWCKVTVTYTDGTTDYPSVTYSSARQGEDGANGASYSNNLLLKSDVLHHNAGYPVAIYNLGAEKPIAGEVYTLTLWGEKGADREWMLAINSSGNGNNGRCELVKVEDGVYRAYWKWKNRVDGLGEDTGINIYAGPNTATSINTIRYAKLEHGENKNPQWTPAAEEMVAPTIVSTETKYVKGANLTAQPTEAQFDASTLTQPGAVSKNQWLWSRTMTTWSDGQVNKSYTSSYAGNDGSTGAPGANGYTHIAYAKGITGSLPHPTGFAKFSTTAFEGAEYIGFCTDHTEADPTDFTKYEWTKYVGEDGEDGRAFVGSTEYYLATADGVNAPTGGWKTDFSQSGFSATNKYLWNYEVSTYTKAPTTVQSTPRIIGVWGQSVTMTANQVHYSTVHNSATQPADNTFTLTAVPALAPGQYLWSRTTVSYSNGQSTKSYAVSRMGEDGAGGANYTPNLIVDSQERITDASGSDSNYFFSTFYFDTPLEVAVGDKLTISVDDIEVLAGTPSEFTANLYDSSNGGSYGTSGTFTKAKPYVTLTVNRAITAKCILLYAGKAGATSGVSVKYHKVMVAKGSTPMSWTPAASEMVGVTIARESVTYAKTSTTTQPADSAFTGTSIGQLNPALGDYIWAKTEVTYTDGTVTKSYGVSRMGADGETAIAGLHMAYATGITGTLPHPTAVTGFATAMATGVAYKYIGIYKDNLEADSTDFRKYEWALFKGEDAAPAKVVNVTGEQVFSYKDDFATLTGPQTIVLRADLQGTSGYQWSYKPEGAAGYTNFQSGTGSSITVDPRNTVLFPGSARSVVVRCTSGGVYDELTVIKVSSGSRGTGYTNNLLRNSDFADGGRYYTLADGVSVDTAMTLDGRASVKTEQSGLTTAVYRGWMYRPEGWNAQTGGSDMPARPGEQITLSAWVRTDNIASLEGYNALLEVHWLDANRSRLASSALVCTPKAENTWEHYALTSKVAPAGTVKVEIRGFVVKNGRLWFNGIKAEYGANDNPVWTPYAGGTMMESSEVRYSTAYNSSTQPADSTFTLTAVPSLAAGQYLWSRTTVTYSDGRTTTAYGVSRNGNNGANGADGAPGADGASYSDNLVLKSNDEKTSSGYHISFYDLSEELVEGQVYTVTIWGEPAPGHSFGIWDQSGAWTQIYTIDKIADGVYSEAFTYNIRGSQTIQKDKISIYNPPPSDFGTSVIHKIKLEHGENKNPQWTPAAEEMVAPTITGTETHYAKGNYPTQPADNLFTLTQPGTLTQGQYLWTRTTTNYSDGASTKSYTVSYIGTDGTQGIPGPTGADGRTSYVHFAYGSGVEGSLPHPTKILDFSTTAFAGARYIGQCTDFNQADPTANPHLTYEWNEYVGTGYTANLLLNSAFIKGLNEWLNWGAPDKREVVESGGKKWLHVVANSSIYQGVNQVVAGKPNTEYTLSALARGAAANQAFGFVVHSILGSTNTAAYYKEATVGTEAERVVLHFTSGANTERLRIMVGRNPATPSDIYFTDIKLEEGRNEHPVWNPEASEMVGEDGYSIVLTNESHDFAGSETAALAASTECGVIAYNGNSPVASHIGAISGMPAGMTVAISGNDTAAAKFTVTVNTAMTTLHGTLNVPITVDGRAFTKKFSWTLARQGVAGKSVTISSTDVRYIQQESATRPADTAFNSAATTPPTAIAGQYLHSRTKVTYSDETSTVTYSVSRMGADGTAWGNGKMLYNDPTFKEGLNSAKVYDNNQSGMTTVVRMADSTAPNDSGQILRVRNTGAGTSPRLGGFYQSTYSGASKEFILRYIMKIPVGYRAVHSNNAVGTDSEFKWLTPTAGTGKWEEYLLRLRCGDTGTFSTFGYVCFDGTAGSASAPVDFLVAYATVFDMGGNGEFKIEKTDVRYILQASAAQPSEAAFDSAATTIPGTLTQGYYLWSRTKVTYSDGKSTSTYGVTRIGADGTDGSIGPTGADGRTSYVHLVYADSVTGSLPHPTGVSGFSTTVKSTSKYIGTRTDFVQADTTVNPQTYYEWSKYVGDNGASYSNNLLLGSKKGWANTGYPTATLQFGEERLAEGEEFTATLWGAELGAGKAYFALYNSNGYISPGSFTDMGGGVFMLKGKWQINGNGEHPAENTHVSIFPIPNSVSGVTSKIGRVKIERGHNDEPVWTPAAEDQLPPTITEQYYLSTSSTALSGGTWSDTKQPWVAGRYYWTRTKLTYADGTLEYTEAICVTGETGTSVLAEYSSDGTSWHPAYTSGDMWMRTSKDNGATWTPGVRIVGSNYTPNLFTGSRDFDGYGGLNQWVKEPETRNGNAVYSRSEWWGGPYQTFAVKKGETYTFSADVKTEGKTSAYLYVNVGGSTPDVTTPSGVNIPVTEGKWTRVHRTITITADGIMHARAESSTSTGKLYISSYKLEEGANASPEWTPAAEEMVGTDGQYRKFQWALGTATAVTGTWQDTPMNAPTGQYVWMHSGVVVPPATTPATWETATRVTGDKGQTGDSAYLLDLTTEHVSVFATTDAAVAVSVSSTARVLAGANIDSGWVFSGVFTGCSGAVNASTGAISVTQLAANVNNATVTVKATKSGYTTLQTTLRIDRIRKGDTGAQGPAGTAAKIVVVNADAQTFTYDNNFTTLVGASTINLSATLQGTTGYQWSYKTPSQSAFTNISGATAATYALAHNASIWGTAKSITLRCTSGGVYDEVTIAKVSSGATGGAGPQGPQGAAGADAYTVLLTNESHTFAGGVSSAVASNTTCEVIAYKGNTRVAASIGNITGQLSGKLTTTVNNQGTATVNAKFTVIATSSLTETSGVLVIPVTVDGKVFNKEFSWSVSRQGQTGNTGAAAIVYSIEPNVDSVTRRADGTLSKSTVSCTKYRTTGSAARAITSSYDLYAQANTAAGNGSWTLVAAEGASVGSIAIGPDTESVVFELRTSMDAVIAHERVPVITVASPSAIGTRNLALNSGGWNLPEGEFDYEELADWTNLNDGCVTRMSGGKLQLYKDAEKTDGWWRNGLVEELSVGSFKSGTVLTLRVKGNVAGLTSGKYVDWTLFRTTDWGGTEIGRVSANGDFDLIKTITVPADYSKTMLGHRVANANAGTTLTIEHVGLYEGNTIPAEWTRAPEDTDYLARALQKATDDSTDIDGGLILAALMRLGVVDSAGVRRIMAGLNGVYNPGAPGGGLAAFFGGDMIDPEDGNADGEAAAAGVRMNGEAFFANNTLRLKRNLVEVGDYLHLQDDGMHMVIDGKETLRVGNAPVTVSAESLANTRRIVDMSLSLSLVSRKYDDSTSTVMIASVLDGGGFFVRHYAEGASSGSAIYSPYSLPTDSTITLNVYASLLRTSRYYTGKLRVNLYQGTTINNGVVVDYCDLPLQRKRSIDLETGTTMFNYWIDNTARFTIGEAGNYYLYAMFIDEKTGGVIEDKNIPITISVKGEIVMGVSSGNVLGNNGLASIWGNNAALYMNDGNFLARIGNYGIHITGGGIKLRLGTTAWKTLGLSGSNLTLT